MPSSRCILFLQIWLKSEGSILEDTKIREKLQGKFIVLDGPDGCGKSTQMNMLLQWLEDEQVAAVSFRDPGATVIGEKIRDILLSPEHDLMDTRTELLLYMAARAQLWKEKIKPALQANKCVVLDRWLSSTCAYQGWAGDFGMDKVLKMAKDCLERVWPDVTIILDIDSDSARKRLDRELDRMEAKGENYHKKVREGFLHLASQQKAFSVVDAVGDIRAIHEEIVEKIASFLG